MRACSTHRIALVVLPGLFGPRDRQDCSTVALGGPNAIYGEGQINGLKAVADLANAHSGILAGKQIEIVPMDIKVGAKDILPSIRRAMERPPM